jgi:hypothetical protein
MDSGYWKYFIDYSTDNSFDSWVDVKVMDAVEKRRLCSAVAKLSTHQFLAWPYRSTPCPTCRAAPQTGCIPFTTHPLRIKAHHAKWDMWAIIAVRRERLNEKTGILK